MRALLAALALFAALAACEPATFHFVNVFPGDSVMMNATVTSPSSTNIKIGNIGFGQTHQPLVLASGALGQAVITTTSSQKYYCTVPLQVAPSMGPGLANIATCVGTSVLTCSALFPTGDYSNAVPASTTLRVLHASLSHRTKQLSFMWQSGTFQPEPLQNVTFGVCGTWLGANLEDWNGNSTLSVVSYSSKGVGTTIAQLSSFNSQSGAVVTFVLADDERGHTQILPIFDGFTQSPVPSLGRAAAEIPTVIVPKN